MIESLARAPVQRWFVNPVAYQLRHIAFLKANHITFLSVIAGGMAMLAIAKGYTVDALIWLCLSGYFDILDGTLARLQGLSSPLGAVLDIVSDRIVESCVILGLLAVAPSARGVLCVLMLISILLCVTTFLVVGIFSHNQSQKGFHYSEGLMERAEAFLFFAAMIVFPMYFRYLALAFSVLTLWTALSRIIDFAQTR